jgi:hypothetical protein
MPGFADAGVRLKPPWVVAGAAAGVPAAAPAAAAVAAVLLDPVVLAIVYLFGFELLLCKSAGEACYFVFKIKIAIEIYNYYLAL